jgi:hypothetical protein
MRKIREAAAMKRTGNGKDKRRSFDWYVRKCANISAQDDTVSRLGWREQTTASAEARATAETDPYGMTNKKTGNGSCARHRLMTRGSAFALPGARGDGVVLPLLASAYEEHDEAEDEHEGSPGEVEVDAHGFFVDVCGVAGEEAVEAHKTADEQEDEAEGDADVESHLSCPFSVVSSQL